MLSYGSSRGWLAVAGAVLLGCLAFEGAGAEEDLFKERGSEAAATESTEGVVGDVLQPAPLTVPLGLDVCLPITAGAMPGGGLEIGLGRTVYTGFIPATAPPAEPQSLLAKGPLEAPLPLPPEAAEVLAGHVKEAEAIRHEAEERLRKQTQVLIDVLQPLQDRYTRDAKLDEAVAIRDLIRVAQRRLITANPDPGTLLGYMQQKGQSLTFEVTGNADGSVWGSDVYTCDSRLAKAAVHAGAVQLGETAVVKVTIVDSPATHESSSRNGITTSPWGAYPASYRVERWSPEAPK